MNHPAGTGLFFSSLVTQQSKFDSREKASKNEGGDITPWADLSAAEREIVAGATPASETEIAFRHGGWMKDRQRVAAALAAAGTPRAVLERFLNCGSGARVEVSEDGARTRITANYCGHRMCRPCQAARARVVRDNLLRWVEGQSTLFLTFTRRDRGDSLTTGLNHLYASSAKLRQQKFWKKAVVAGASFTEITLGKNRDHWHVHLHMIVVAKWLPLEVLREGWRKASGGSFKVSVQRVRDAGRQVAYVADYATKGFSREVLLDHDRLVECICSLRGRRLLATFGRWGRLSMEPGDGLRTGWRSVGSLNRVAAAARAGEQWAIGCFRSLGFVVLIEPDGIEFQRIDGPPGQTDLRERSPPARRWGLHPA